MTVLGPSPSSVVRALDMLVPVAGDEAAALHAVDVAAGLACGGTIRLVAVVEVPPTLPLDAQLPEAELPARAALARAQALAESRGVRATIELRRGRDAGAVLAAAADEARVDEIVVATALARHRRLNVDRTTRTLLRRARCRVVVLRAGRS